MDILYDKEQILYQIVDRLGKVPVNYTDRMAFMKDQNRDQKKWRAAGVLLPLHFKEHSHNKGPHEGEFVLQLIKRSTAVSQGGDISGPGGMLDPRLDVFLRSLLLHRIPPAFSGASRKLAMARGKTEFTNIALFFANALRESWEEIRLSPLNVKFLGALPFQNLILLRKQFSRWWVW